MAAYVAVGVWHHWLVRRDLGVRRARMWPTVRRALDFVCALQLPFGGIAWSQEWTAPTRRGQREALLAGSSSIHHALRAGLTLAELLDDPQPEWELAAGPARARRCASTATCFLDKSTFSMDWYYPVLGGAVRGDARARRCSTSRWDDFVVPGLGVRCVDTNPWVTGAETCELVLALDALGDRDRARRLFADVQHLRQRRRRLLDRLRLPRRRALAGGAHDVHDRRGAARPRRAGRARRRAPASSAAPALVPDPRAARAGVRLRVSRRPRRPRLRPAAAPGASPTRPDLPEARPSRSARR